MSALSSIKLYLLNQAASECALTCQFDCFKYCVKVLFLLACSFAALHLTPTPPTFAPEPSAPSSTLVSTLLSWVMLWVVAGCGQASPVTRLPRAGVCAGVPYVAKESPLHKQGGRLPQ